MKSLILPGAMGEMEKRYFAQTGTPSINLMERAARMLCDGIIRRYGSSPQIWFACGPGGNGGDGYACARMYAQAGGKCAVVPIAPPRSPDAVENLRLVRAMGISELNPGDLHGAPDIWVDALYGTGLSRAPEGAAAILIERMNADHLRGSAVVAVDIPSGLNGATGSAWRPCVRADLTITFQFAKAGHFLGDGLDMCGMLEVADIGIPSTYYPDHLIGLVDDAELRDALPARPRNLHKGNCGHLLIVAGSQGMAGAAVLCAQAALRSGVGLATIACPQSIVPILQTLAPCAMCLPLPEENGALSKEAVEPLKGALKGKTAAVCGCGLSRQADPDIVRLMLSSGLPVLFDADALNLIAGDRFMQENLLRPHHLITPHPGEAARLLGRAVIDPIKDALALRERQCQVLLKGATCVIPDKDRVYLSASGCCGMARGGSGDILAGIIGALLAERAAGTGSLSGDAIAKCAAVGSEIHGLAGELAQKRYGARGMCSQDIVEALPEVWKRYE